MALSPRDMDGFLPLLCTADTKAKLTIANNLILYLADPENSIECSDIGQFIDSLIPWMQSSNNKVSQSGIDAMTYLVDRMNADFRPYIPTVLPPIVDRLGDSKEMVREKAQLFILKLMEREVIKPQELFEKLGPAFSHKNGKIREEIMVCLQRTLTEHGAHSISVSRHIPAIIKLLSDPASSVRDTAFNTLVEIYRHVGDRLRQGLKKHNVPAPKLQMLMSRFDELRDAGEILPSASIPEMKSEDDVDTTVKSRNRASSVPRKSAYQTSKSATTSGQAGAVDEDTFYRAFEDVPTVQLFSARELDDQLTVIRETINDPNKDWSKRVEALKRLRSLLIAGAAKYDELYTHLRLLEQPFQTTVKDLRSQVVREACYTIAYLSEQLGNKCDHFAEYLLNSLINLIQNSAKVMASAGLVTVRFIIRYTHYSRFIPIIISNLSSKSKDIRRACCEFLEQLLQSWSPHILERHLNILQDAIKKGIADADPEARLCARKAYWSFRSNFPDQADQLLNSLDTSYKRALNGELTLSNSSSSNSLHQQGTSRYNTTSRTRLSSSATEGLGSPRRSTGSPGPSTLRSNSAIDLQAAQRAKARAQYAALARNKIGSGASLPRPRKTSDITSSMTSSVITSPERVGRTRSRMAGVSQSQPSSRSGSPSSRLSYATYGVGSRDTNPDSPQGYSTHRRLSGIPRSTGTSREASRETSPNRYNIGGLSNPLFGSKLRNRTHITPDRPPQSSRPVMAQKILQQSREAESALADALNFDSLDSIDCNRPSLGRKPGRSLEDHSDDSETSSVCSERSLDSFRRPSDSFSWSGSQPRLHRDMLDPPCKDITEIIANCASNSWTERKEGLVGLQVYFQNGSVLSATELKRVTEIFTKMFMDPHTKVFSLFLDTLNELIQTHRADLNDWLYILLTRLLNKLGADILGSIQSKIHKSLVVVRDAFPHELQMNAIMRFVVDQTQTPNSKVKVAMLTYLAQLATNMEPSAFNPVAKDSTSAALAKIISWTKDVKSSEIRKAANTAVIALFNLNTPQFTMLLTGLPAEYQETAGTLVQQHLRRSSSGSGSSPPSPSPLLQSPSTPQHGRPLKPDLEDENLNPEEVYRHLRRTTAEIQNYSFEASVKLLDRDRDTTSQDSGISQMSAGPGDKLDTLEEHIEDMSITRSNSGRSSSLSSPIHRLNSLQDFNGVTTIGENGCTISGPHTQEERSAIQKFIEILRTSENGGSSETDCRNALSQLSTVVREGSTSAIIEQFKSLLRGLLHQLGKAESPVIRTQVLVVLTDMFKNQVLGEYFKNYIELLVLKILETHRDSNKEVVRAAEICAATMGTMLQPEILIGVLNPLIKTGEYPINLGAIKMLTKLVEQKGREAIEQHLSEIMCALIKAYDNPESPVRKSAVFCMVALHAAVGEAALQPHLETLNTSKLKLLHLYIKRAQQGSSVPTSPKNAPS